MFNPYTKAILAAAIAIAGGFATGWDDSVLTTSEIVIAIVAGLTALAVVWASHPVVKWLWSAAIAGATAVGVALQDDAISAQEWVTIALATLTALYLVYQTPNTPANNHPSN
jgi:hypothetical protein